jgi:hypothetical protein
MFLEIIRIRITFKKINRDFVVVNRLENIIESSETPSTTERILGFKLFFHAPLSNVRE